MKRALLLILINLWFLGALARQADIKLPELQIKEHPHADTFTANHLNKTGLYTSLNPARLNTSATGARAISAKTHYQAGDNAGILSDAFALQKDSNSAYRYKNSFILYCNCRNNRPIVKGHGGSIAVDLKEGEVTAFNIQLPNN